MALFEMRQRGIPVRRRRCLGQFSRQIILDSPSVWIFERPLHLLVIERGKSVSGTNAKGERHLQIEKLIISIHGATF